MATRLATAYDQQVMQVRQKILTYANRQWASLGSYRDVDAERLIAALVPRVEAGQLRIAQLTDAYIARTAAAAFGGPIKRGQVVDSTTQGLRGVAADVVYARPFVTVYTKLSKGKTPEAAFAAGGARLASLVTTGMQLASTHAARQAMDRAGVESFERVLTGRENCALCVIASTQRYHRGDLLPIHGGCDCGVRVLKDGGTAQVLDAGLLEQMHSAVEAQFGGTDRSARILDGLNDRSDYLDLISTREHGEIGPVLTWRDQHFTGPRSIRA